MDHIMCGVHFGLFLIYLDILMISSSASHYGPVRMCNGDYETPGRCFVSVDHNRKWDAAEDYCENSLLPSSTPSGINRKGHLAAIEDAESQSLVAAEATNRGWESTWINGRLALYIWFWQKHWGVLAYQGCWKDDPNNPDLAIVLPVTPNTKPTDCLAMCTEIGNADSQHKYYVLGIQKDAQGDIVCRCGGVWNKKHGRSYSSLCDSVCPGSGITMTGGVMDRYCGDNGHQLIYFVDGQQFHRFARSNVRSYNHCVVMNPEQNYQWTEHDCHVPQPFICHHDFSEDQCGSLATYKWANGACITLHMDPLSFYKAQGKCAELRAYLLKVENSDVHDAVKKLLDNVHKFYIALTDEEWVFSYWKLVFKYFNWGTNQPAQGRGQNCFTMKRDDNYRWYNIDCNTSLPFMCMVEIHEDEMKAQTEATTTEQLNTEVPDKDTLTTGVSQELFIGIGAGVGGTIVIVIIILFIVWCCRRRKKQNKEQQQQSRNHQPANQALPHPSLSGRSQGAPVANPSYQPDVHMGHDIRRGGSQQSFNDPHYLEPSQAIANSIHEYTNLEEPHYDYIEPNNLR